MNDQNTYLKVLWGDIRTYSFVLLLAMVLISIFSDAWMLSDGALFHFQNYFIGRLNNDWDPTRYAAVITTDVFNLSYVLFGGKNFFISNYLFRFGHAYHLFFPFFLLTYLKYKEPSLRRWAEVSFNYYLLSLSMFLGLSFLMYVTEMKAAHTFTWLMLLTFRSQSMGHDNNEFKHSFLWSTSIFALFTYPLAGIGFAFMLIAQLLPTIDAPGENRENWKIFNFLMFIFSAGLYFYYISLTAGSDNVFSHFKSARSNETIQFMCFAAVALILIKPFFRTHYFFVVPILALVYVLGAMGKLWHSNPGRFVGIIFVILIQAFYVFITPLLRKEAAITGIRNRSFAVGTLVLVVMLYQSHRLDRYNGHFLDILDMEKKDLNFSELKEKMPSPYKLWVTQWSIEAYSINLQLVRGRNPVGNFVKKDPGTPSDYADILLKNPDFPKILSNRNIAIKSLDSYISGETASLKP